MKRRTYLTAVKLTVLLLALAAGSHAATETATQIENFTLVDGGRFVLSNVNGEIEIEGWSGAELTLEAVKQARAGSQEAAQEVLDKIRLDIDRSSDLVEIETRLPRSNSGFSFGRGTSGSVRYTLKVPAGLQIDITTVNGSIDARNVDGQMILRSTNGAIDVESASGSVRAATTNGRIRVQLDEVTADEDLKFSTTNGSIRLQVPADIQADLEARTVNGSIESDLPVEVQGRLSRRRLEGAINGGGAALSLSTTNGSIRLATN